MPLAGGSGGGVRAAELVDIRLDEPQCGADDDRRHQPLGVGHPDIEAAFENARALGLRLKDAEIQSIPTFWERGIRYFNAYGPNGETIEFCQIV